MGLVIPNLCKNPCVSAYAPKTGITVCNEIVFLKFQASFDLVYIKSVCFIKFTFWLVNTGHIVAKEQSRGAFISTTGPVS